MSLLRRLRQAIGPTEAELLARHAREAEIRQSYDAERPRNADAPAPTPGPDQRIIRRILYGSAVPPMECWRW